jgi:hypothetical protein
MSLIADERCRVRCTFALLQTLAKRLLCGGADSDDPGQGFQLKAATIPIEGGQYWPVGMFMGSQRW